MAVGIMLNFLYSSAGILLVPFLAHFGSNVMESIGMKWGLLPFLAVAAGVVILQFLAPKKIPQEPSKKKS